jgi:putative ABC transport system ATP-binding protein
MAEHSSLIRVEHVDRVYDDGAVTALRDINLIIRPNECAAIVGKSGSGKSSLIHIMSGCDAPTAGTVYWHDESIWRQEDWRRLRATRIGIVFQEFHLLPALTAAENVELALMGHCISAADRARRASSLLERVGLSDRARHLPTELSGGERQRVAIARSIANDPELILADEPTGNLDSANADAVVELLLNIRRDRGAALILVTHDESLAARCDWRIRLKDGAIETEQEEEATEKEEKAPAGKLRPARGTPSPARRARKRKK